MTDNDADTTSSETEADNLGELRPHDEAEAPRPQRSSPPALIAIAIAMTVASLFLGWRLYEAGKELDQAQATAEASADAAKAAGGFAVAVATYSPGELDENFNNVLKRTTGQFREDYESASSSLRKSIVTLKGRSTAKVHYVGIVKASRSQAEAIVFLDQIVRNSQMRTPRTDRTRMHLTLVHKNDRWLVTKLSLV